MIPWFYVRIHHSLSLSEDTSFLEFKWGYLIPWVQIRLPHSLRLNGDTWLLGVIWGYLIIWVYVRLTYSMKLPHYVRLDVGSTLYIVRLCHHSFSRHSSTTTFGKCSSFVSSLFLKRACHACNYSQLCLISGVTWYECIIFDIRSYMI